MSDVVADLRIVGLAVMAWFGATAALPLWWLVLPAGFGAFAARRAGRSTLALTLAGLALALVTSSLAARSLHGLRLSSTGSVEGSVILVTDPEPTGDGRIRADVRLGTQRLWAEARAPLAVSRLRGRLAGEQVMIRGTLSTWSERPDWATARHLAGRLRIEFVSGARAGAPHAAAANTLRRLLERGATSLTSEHRSLLAGLTLGDDRAQTPAMISDFRASGLTHLLAVSGQNVAFLMVVFGPLLRRLRIWPRFFTAVGLVLAFAFVTRFEPSVVRAAVMAVVALWAMTIGRPSGGVRSLALAVCGLLVVDPLLTRSVGFRLSVAACTGVLVLAPLVAERLRGPRWVREGLAVTAGAQLAVAPVLIPTFGPMPLAALPANIAAGPVAGALMVWGITGGVVAGICGGTVAAVLHLPSAVGLLVLERVAALSASLPLGTIDLRGVAVLAGAAGLAAVPVARRRVLLAAAAALVAIVGLTAIRVRPLVGEVDAGWAASVWTDGPVAIVDLRPGASAVAVLDVLRERRVSVVGAVVVRSGRSELVGVVDSLRDRFPVRVVLAPPTFPFADAIVPRPGVRIAVAGFVVDVEAVVPTLDARVGWRTAGVRDPHE